MQRTRIPILVFGLALTCLAHAPSTAVAGLSAASALVAANQEFIRGKPTVPDDPLAGLPTEDGPNRGKGHAGDKPACALQASAADQRDIGDLRATLAFVQLGPGSWPCRGRAANAELRLRLYIDETGKVTEGEPVAENGVRANALVKRLVGRAIGPGAAGATSGIVVVTFSNSRH